MAAKVSAKVKPKADADEVITSYKGFDKDFRCYGEFQFEVGKTYEHKGKVQACQSGFHACEDPLHVLRYYNPAQSRFAVVKQSGDLSRHDDDSKIASRSLTVEAEISLASLISAGMKFRFSKVDWSKGPVATRPNEGAKNDDKNGAATASGNYGAATASGDSGAATASGHSGHASALGPNGKARAREGASICLRYLDDNYKLIHVWAGIAGRDGIKPDTFYTLGKDGKPVEAA